VGKIEGHHYKLAKSMHLHSKRVDGWKRSSLRSIVLLLLELNLEHLIHFTKLAMSGKKKTKGCNTKNENTNRLQ